MTAAAKRAAPLFAALGDETRLALLARLSADGPASTARLRTGSRVTRQAIAKHLGVLADAGLVRGQRRGREVLWRLAPERLGAASEYLEEISRRWDRALASLKAFVES